MSALTPEAVAAGLTKAQKRIILMLRTDGTFADSYITCKQRRTRMKLNDIGVTEPKVDGAVTSWWLFRLTPLGLQVRALLQADPRS